MTLRKMGRDRKRGYPERGEGVPSEKRGLILVETSICKKLMASPKIDFYYEVFKQV